MIPAVMSNRAKVIKIIRVILYDHCSDLKSLIPCKGKKSKHNPDNSVKINMNDPLPIHMTAIPYDAALLYVSRGGGSIKKYPSTIRQKDSG